jgi:hypothetical protein
MGQAWASSELGTRFQDAQIRPERLAVAAGHGCEVNIAGYTANGIYEAYQWTKQHDVAWEMK